MTDKIYNSISAVKDKALKEIDEKIHLTEKIFEIEYEKPEYNDKTALANNRYLICLYSASPALSDLTLLYENLLKSDLNENMNKNADFCSKIFDILNLFYDSVLTEYIVKIQSFNEQNIKIPRDILYGFIIRAKSIKDKLLHCT